MMRKMGAKASMTQAIKFILSVVNLYIGRGDKGIKDCGGRGEARS